MEEVARELKPVLDYRTQMVASVAGGVGLADLSTLYRHKNMLPPLFYVMPNTAVAVRQSMTFVAAQGASEEQTAAVVNLFRLLGEAMLVEERLMDGAWLWLPVALPLLCAISVRLWKAEWNWDFIPTRQSR